MNQQTKKDLETVNANLLYLLELLTPMEGERTGAEQVYFDIVLSSAKKLPVSNNLELSKYN